MVLCISLNAVVVPIILVAQTILYKRLNEHQNGHGSNFTKGRLPVKLVYFEKYNRIDKAFFREKQIQG